MTPPPHGLIPRAQQQRPLVVRTRGRPWCHRTSPRWPPPPPMQRKRASAALMPDNGGSPAGLRGGWPVLPRAQEGLRGGRRPPSQRRRLSAPRCAPLLYSVVVLAMQAPIAPLLCRSYALAPSAGSPVQTPTGTFDPLRSARSCRHLERRLPPAAAEARLDQWQPYDQSEVIVRGDPVVSLQPAAEAAVDEDVLPLRTDEDTDRRHRLAAVGGTVARPVAVHVSGVEATGTVVAEAAAARQRANEHAAVTAAEGFARVWPAVWV